MAIDNCQISDAALANILEGIASHACTAHEKNSVDFRYHELKSLVISNVNFGKHCCEKIKLLSKELIEFKLNNLRFNAKSNSEIMKSLITEF